MEDSLFSFNFRTYDKATTVMTMWHRHEQINGLELSPEINPYMLTDFDKDAKIIQWGKNSLLNTGTTG